MKPWITKRITELMGFEDDVVIDFCIGSLTDPNYGGENEKGLCPKLLQVNMTGFMERKAATFCSELWKNLISANKSPVGVPQEFIDAKKNELAKKKEEADKVQEELKRRKAELQEARDQQRKQEEAKRAAERVNQRDSNRREAERPRQEQPRPKAKRSFSSESGGRSRSPRDRRRR